MKSLRKKFGLLAAVIGLAFFMIMWMWTVGVISRVCTKRDVVTEKKISEVRNLSHGNIERLMVLEKSVAASNSVKTVGEMIDIELKRKEILKRLERRYADLYVSMVKLAEAKRDVKTKKEKIEDASLKELRAENKRMLISISSDSKGISEIWSMLLNEL